MHQYPTDIEECIAIIAHFFNLKPIIHTKSIAQTDNSAKPIFASLYAWVWNINVNLQQSFASSTKCNPWSCLTFTMITHIIHQK